MNKKLQIGSIEFIILICLVIIFLVGGIGWYAYDIRTRNVTLTQPTQTHSVEEKGILRIAQTIDENGPEADSKEYAPFISYLVNQLKDQGFTKGQFIGAKSVSEMALLVKEGKVDMVIDSAFPVYVVDKLSDTITIADRWKGGVASYHSAIFVKKDSSIKTLDDLKGKMIAFDSPSSTTGYFLPKAELIKQGYTLTEKQMPTDPCKPSEICYIFKHGDIYTSVADGTVPAGAESEVEIDAFFGKEIANYRIISRTPDIPRFLVAIRGDMNASLKEKISSTLFAMDASSQGQKVLQSFADTAKFTPVTDTNITYGVIKDLANIVENEIVQQ